MGVEPSRCQVAVCLGRMENFPGLIDYIESGEDQEIGNQMDGVEVWISSKT